MPPTPLTHEFYFAVGMPAGVRSCVWHVWNPPGTDDVYIAEETMRNVFKVSLHESGEFHVGFAREFVRDGAPGANAGLTLKNRLKGTWDGVSVHPAAEIGFRLGIPTDELSIMPRSEHEDRVVFLEPAPAGEMLEIGFFLIAPRTIPREGGGTSILWNHELQSGRTLSIWSKQQPYGNDLRSRIHATRAQIEAANLAGGPALRALVGGPTPDGAHFFVDVGPAAHPLPHPSMSAG